MSEIAAAPRDPRELIRSREYRVLLVLAAVIGVVVSFASWGFLEGVYYIQQGVYDDLPDWLGFDTVPWWWPLPWVAIAGVLTAFAVVRLPGGGGHVPADGLKAGGKPTRPVDLPGVLLAAFATLGLGLVLGPEAPLIALGAGLGALSLKLLRKDAPDQALGLMAAAGSFAAINSLFGSPALAAVLMIEVTGLGGAMLPVVLLPGLLAAGVGSLVFLGMGEWTGLSTSAISLSPISLPAFPHPGWGDFAWTIVLSVAVAVVTFAIVELAQRIRLLVEARPFLLTTVAGLVVGVLAIAFNLTTDEPVNGVLFSGQDEFSAVFGADLSTSTLAWLLLFKSLAWSVSLASFRGGPTFPALFLGAVAGLLASHLPGLSETPAVVVCMAAACVAMLRLPLSTIVIVLFLTFGAGAGTGPLIVVGAVVAYIVVVGLDAVRDAGRAVGSADPAPEAGTT